MLAEYHSQIVLLTFPSPLLITFSNWKLSIIGVRSEGRTGGTRQSCLACDKSRLCEWHAAAQVDGGCKPTHRAGAKVQNRERAQGKKQKAEQQIRALKVALGEGAGTSLAPTGLTLQRLKKIHWRPVFPNAFSLDIPMMGPGVSNLMDTTQFSTSVPYPAPWCLPS